MANLEEITYDGEPLDIEFSNYEEEILINNAQLALAADDPQEFTITYRTFDDTQLHTAQAAAR